MSATLSLLGLYQYNPQLFDGLRLPADVDKNTLVDNLIVECAEFEILYADPFFLANMISVWSAKELPTWEKLVETLKFQYDPISNYDRKEEWTDENSGTMRNSESGTNTNSESGTSKNSENGTSKNTANSNGNTNGTDTKKVAGYNAGSLVTSEENTTEVETNLESETNGETTRNFEAEETRENTSEISRQFTNETSGNNKRTGRAYGNIGVTTTQQMIEEERRIVKFNINDYIIDSFKRRFCLLIY